ncbi:hypothetical protein IW140_002640 [Coemansia sp. RSA 1813]|nr:hypothetical protein EV178_000283 [Coemansia sp. RSA 1646]KAJ1772071.1 hypothetical protein LPJ74_001807 [Coemansia sp. RSA 1843]KAJ2090409.1 hypothetical protein IW138_002620 [Coemansia sp. RSA 986]KAJ2215375.1 hypothetical protein EV179_002159 [Coemansia sp. RSA 487]KAJ2569964.1 hypothetical protein IW140_002640 [Coemansia sp. RSA 1813]
MDDSRNSSEAEKIKEPNVQSAESIGEESLSSLDATALASISAPQASQVADVDPSDPLQEGLQLAMQAVWLFLDSDFEKVERVMGHKRHSLLYASEGYTAINYMRAMMTFTREAMQSAQDAAQSTINLAAHYRKPRGVTGLLSGQTSRASSPMSSRDQTPAASKDSDTSNGQGKPKPHGLFRIDSPRLTLRSKKAKQREKLQQNNGDLQRTHDSTTSMESLASTERKQPFDPALLDAKYSELQESDSTPMSTEYEDELDRKQARSWTTGIATVADSLIGIVRAGTQAAGLSRPEWHALRAMTPTQRHAELVHAEAHLMRAMLNVAVGDGIMALLREGWHVRSAYATYRNCYAFIQDAYTAGEALDDHFVSGTYFGMGVFNIVLSMLPAKLLRFIELVGFSADRALGIELLYIAAGWRSDPLTAPLMSPPPLAAASLHPCGYGLRSEFCSLVLQIYHVFLCNDLFLGYPNLPLVEAVLRSCLQKHPSGLLYMYFEGRLLMTRTHLDDAIARYTRLVHEGKGVVESMHLATVECDDPSATSAAEDQLVADLSKLAVDGSSDTSASEDSENSSTPTSAAAAAAASGASAGVAAKSTQNVSEWRQLQYLGYWERSLCLMALGRWLEAAEGFNTLRKENNWNKAVYTYALACCLWEHYLVTCNRKAPEDPAELSDRQKQLLKIVCDLMHIVPSLKRKVAGKSIPIEKFVIRKSRKFHSQGSFLMRPGLELLHVWNLYCKIPQNRLGPLAKEIDADIDHLAQFQPALRSTNSPYRHANYYDDLALLLLTKGYAAKELAHPSYKHTLSPPVAEDEQQQKEANCAESANEQSSIAVDSLVRVLRLMPFIELDHYIAALARFHLGDLYLEMRPGDEKWTNRALAQWKAILDGKPMTMPPLLSMDEYKACTKLVSSKDAAAAVPTCATDEAILKATGHPSLLFYDGSWQMSEWKHYPPRWSDSRKYSLENMIEVRAFNATNRLKESMGSDSTKL